jgi:hypothetical protein
MRWKMYDLLDIINVLEKDFDEERAWCLFKVHGGGEGLEIRAPQEARKGIKGLIAVSCALSSLATYAYMLQNTQSDCCNSSRFKAFRIHSSNISESRGQLSCATAECRWSHIRTRSICCQFRSNSKWASFALQHAAHTSPGTVFWLKRSRYIIMRK